MKSKHFDLAQKFLEEEGEDEINLYEGMRLVKFSDWLESNSGLTTVTADVATRCEKHNICYCVECFPVVSINFKQRR